MVSLNENFDYVIILRKGYTENDFLEKWKKVEIFNKQNKNKNGEKKWKKRFKIITILFLSVFLLTGCGETCNDVDKANIIEAIKIQNQDLWELEAIDLEIDESYREKFYNEKAAEEFKKHPQACITNEENSIDPTTGAQISRKTWSDAFKIGIIDGLLVYPTAMMLIFFTKLLGGEGVAKIFSIVFVTIIVRLLTLLLTLKSSMQSQKMQSIQPELAEIQNKIKATTDASEKQRLSGKMMDVYKKHGINPLSSMLMPFVSFPIFIAVWRAVSGTLILRSGTVLGVNLGVTLKDQIFTFNIWAIILFIVMGASQFISMKLPMWLAKKK